MMNNIKIGTSIIDITPPLEVGVLMSSVKQQHHPFVSVRLPLKGRIIVIGYNNDLIAIVSLDLLGINHTASEGWQQFKSDIGGAIRSEKIVITCTHTHSSPETAGLTDLYKTEIFKSWWRKTKQKIKTGIENAIKNLKESSLSIGISELQGYSLQRRVLVDGEIQMSDSMQPIASKLFEKGPIDRRVRALKFHDNNGTTITTMVHAVCHPVNEMCSYYVSPDYPGELCLELENGNKSGIPLFLNGCCGDINPPTVSGGAACSKEHGLAIAHVVNNIQWQKNLRSTPVKFLGRNLKMKIREKSGVDDENNGIVRLNVLRMGDLVFVFLPGEPFIATAFEIEKNSPFRTTIVIGYSENYVGYIPTKKNFEEGGYEAGPGKWSYLEKNSEQKIRNEIADMLKEVHS